ncbi:tyrosine-type recombinase/integrase [Devosia riboflavina]
MARKIPNLLLRDGRYYARKIVPLNLRPYIGRSELREPLGADRRIAIENLPGAMVVIKAQLDHARRALEAHVGAEAARAAVRAAPMSAEEIARTHYNDQLALDEKLRNAGPSWASVTIDDGYVADLRAAAAGSLSDSQIEELLGSFLKRYTLRGNLQADGGTAAWRQAARAIADAELQALAQMSVRDDGAARHEIIHAPHLAPVEEESVTEPFVEPLSLRRLLEKHLKQLEANGGGVSARKAWTRVFEDLLQFLKTTRGLKGASVQQADDARRLTGEEVIAWRDAKLETLSPKTVKDVWLASLKAVLSDAVSDRLLGSNVAKGIRVKIYSAPQIREKGFTDTEALAVLKRCLNYQPASRENPAKRESEHVTAAKRWGPWLCAFTGARVAEILQLRKCDVLTAGDITYVHITPDAGPVKGKKYRDVPLHPQLVELGFLEFVNKSPEGPLFHSTDADPAKAPAQAVAARVGKWLQAEGLVPKGVQPNHGWRHRFKTLAREAGLDPHVVDSIQGHSGRTASDGYGNVRLGTKLAAIAKLRHYDV